MYVYIYKTSYILKLLGEFSSNKNNNSVSTYSRRNLLKEDLLKLTSNSAKYLTLPIMYRLPKMHKTTTQQFFQDSMLL